VEPDLGPLRQPVDELADVLDLVVRGVERDLPGGAAESAGGPGEHRVAAGGEPLGGRAHALLAAAEPVGEEHRGGGAARGGREEGRIEPHPLIAGGAVHHGDGDVRPGDGPRGGPQRPQQRTGHQDRQGDRRRQGAPSARECHAVHATDRPCEPVRPRAQPSSQPYSQASSARPLRTGTIWIARAFSRNASMRESTVAATASRPYQTSSGGTPTESAAGSATVATDSAVRAENSTPARPASALSPARRRRSSATSAAMSCTADTTANTPSGMSATGEVTTV